MTMINTFIYNIDSGFECAFGRFADDTKPSCAGAMLREESAKQQDLDRLEEQACVNLKVLHLGQGTPQYLQRVRDEWIEGSPAEKDLGSG